MSSPETIPAEWWSRFNVRHTRVVVGCLLAAIVSSLWVTAMDLSLQVQLLALFVALAGLPHGALDLALLRGLGMSGLRLAGALGLYVLIAGAVLLGFALFPVATLTGFLALAAIHFGLGDTESLHGWRRILEASARAGIAVLAPAYFHVEETGSLFAQLCGQDHATSAQHLAKFLGGWLGFAWGVVLIGACFVQLFGADVKQRRSGRWVAAEMGLLLAVFALWPPLPAFVLYFCGVHSVRHLAEIGSSHHPFECRRAWRWLLAESWLLTVVTIMVAALVWWGARDTGDEILLRIVFQGLASLTAPHMLLVYVWHVRAGGQ